MITIKKSVFLRVLLYDFSYKFSAEPPTLSHVVYKDVKAITYVHALRAFFGCKGNLPILYLVTM